MGRFGEADLGIQFPPDGNKDHPLTHLRHAVKRSIQKSVSNLVADPLKEIACLLSNVLAAVVQYIRYVLHHQRQREEGLDVAKILQIEPSARVQPERLGMFGHFAKLRPPNPRESLARWPSNQHIDCLFNWAEI